jgi:hypothetical protein
VPLIVYCNSAKLNVRIVRIPTTCSHCKTFTAYILVSIHISASSCLLLCSHHCLLYMCLAMLHSALPGFLWFCTYLCFARIFKSFSLLFHFVSFLVLTAIMRCVFRTDVFCVVCFSLIASLMCFVLLESNCGWQKNRFDKSSGAVRGCGLVRMQVLQIQIDVLCYDGMTFN